MLHVTARQYAKLFNISVSTVRHRYTYEQIRVIPYDARLATNDRSKHPANYLIELPLKKYFYDLNDEQIKCVKREIKQRFLTPKPRFTASEVLLSEIEMEVTDEIILHFQEFPFDSSTKLINYLNSKC